MSSAANPTDLHQTLLQALLQARQAADKAAAFIQGHAGSVDGTHARNKGTHDLVSHVDEGAQDLIVDHLQSAFPEHTFLLKRVMTPNLAPLFHEKGTSGLSTHSMERRIFYMAYPTTEYLSPS